MIQTEGRVQRIANNTLFLYGAEAWARLFSWAILAFLTRHWMNVGTYGQYALVVNWIAILAVFSEMGLNVLVVREVAHHRSLALFYLRYAIVLRSIFSLVFEAGLIGLSFWLGYEPVIKIALAVMGLRVLLDSVSGGYVYLFQSHEMMGFYALTNVLSAAVRLTGIVVVVELGGGVIAACSIWTVASAVTLLVLAWKGHRLGWKPNFVKMNLKEAFSLLRQSLPLATFGSLQMLYYRVDSVILKSLMGNVAVGYYDLAAKVVFVVLAFSQIFGTALFPALSSVKDDSRAFGKMANWAFKILLLLGMPAMVGGVLLAHSLILLVSGEKYLPSVPLFAVLMLSVGAYYLSNVYVIALAIYSSLRLNLQFALLFVLNVVLNFVLIPRMGAMGASWATVSCEVFGLLFGFYLAFPYLKYFQWLTLTRPIMACLGAALVMGSGIWLDARLYWIVLGPIVYVVGLYLFGALQKDEWKNIFAVLKSKESSV